MLIVTGANRSYFRTLCQFLLSYRRVGCPHPLVIYDLGLTPGQRDRLAQNYEVRVFPFERYPEHVRMERANYSWKPIIIADLVLQTRGKVFWLDSAAVLLAGLDRVQHSLEETGSYAPYAGGGPMRILPAALALTEINPALAGLRPRAALCTAFDGGRDWVRVLVARWKEFALTPAIQAPPGGRKEVHNFDQSLLSLLLYEAQEKGLVKLTTDSLDISSPNPVPFLRTRNKVKSWIPLAADPMVRFYYWCYRVMDVLVLRLRFPGPETDQPTRP